MNRILPLILFALPLLMIPQVRASEQKLEADAKLERREDGTGFILKPGMFLAAMQPKELNDVLTNSIVINDQKMSGKIGAAAGFTIDAGYSINRNFAMGTKLEYFTGGISRSHSVNGFSYNDEANLSGLVPYLTASAHTEVVPRFLLGLTAGIGTPIFYHFDYDYTMSYEDRNSKGGATYGATPVAGFAAITAAVAVSRRVSIATEIGYKMLNAGRMTATGSGRDDLKDSVKEGDVFKYDNKDVRINASAPYVNVGVTVTL